MKCPVDGQVLSIADRQGVEIDYCPTSHTARARLERCRHHLLTDRGTNTVMTMTTTGSSAKARVMARAGARSLRG